MLFSAFPPLCLSNVYDLWFKRLSVTVRQFKLLITVIGFHASGSHIGHEITGNSLLFAIKQTGKNTNIVMSRVSCHLYRLSICTIDMFFLVHWHIFRSVWSVWSQGSRWISLICFSKFILNLSLSKDRIFHSAIRRKVVQETEYSVWEGQSSSVKQCLLMDTAVKKRLEVFKTRVLVLNDMSLSFVWLEGEGTAASTRYLMHLLRAWQTSSLRTPIS